MVALSQSYESTDEFVTRIDSMLAYLARYGHQDMRTLEREVPRVTLIAWMAGVSDLVQEENDSMEGGRGR